jgi:hypothetical protein
VGGAPVILVPARLCPRAIPLIRRSRYADATVAGLSPSSAATDLTAGSAAPGWSLPSRTAASMSATSSLALEPYGR